MRIRQNNIIKLLTCGLLLGGLTSCSDTQLEDTNQYGEIVSKGNSYIMLSFKQPSSQGTRSTDNPPKGGELGDGIETGQDYENIVTSAAIFLYEGDETVDVNTASANTPVTMVEFNSFTEENYTQQAYDYIAVSKAQPAGVVDGTYRVLAIANPKDLSWARVGNLTLGDVRDHIEKTAWTETIASGTTSYSSFLMTSENDKKGSIITITDENTEDNPASTFVEVERMAARIDYQTEGSYEIAEGDLGDNDFSGATIEIIGATIVNNLTAGSYFLKRVSKGYGEEVTYLGDEEADGNDIATNYVIDPWTDDKDGQKVEVTIDGETKKVSDLYGVYYPGIVTEGEEENPSFWDSLMKTGNEITEDGETWNILGYTMENTTYAEYTSKDYSTAIVFGAKFTPIEGMVRNSFFSDYTFNYGQSTFFRWNNKLYATIEDMMMENYPSTAAYPFTRDDMFGELTFENITTIDDLKEFVTSLDEDDPTGYKAYLQGIVDEGELPSDISSLYWVNYMQNVCHYYFDRDKSEISIEEDTRAILYKATNERVRTYEDSKCYYTWWIRHSNDDSDETNGIMEYSIVRNNIYKINVTSVYSIGGDVPDDGLRIRVYVKKWGMYDKETIDL